MVLPNSHATVITMAHDYGFGGSRMAAPRDLVPEVDPYLVRLLDGLHAEHEPNHLEPMAAGLHGHDSQKLDELDVRNENWSPYDWR